MPWPRLGRRTSSDTPQVIGRLVRAAVAGELDISPVRVSTNSEPLSEDDRDAVRSAWGAPVHTYGAQPRSESRPWAAAKGLACMCARTRSY
jgi:hypothetical protein